MINPMTFRNTEEELYRLNIQENTYSRGNLVGIYTSDLHFGVMNSEYQYNLLRKQQLDILETIYFNFMVINGDTFDHKFMSSSDAIMYAIKYIDNCVDICRRKQATLIILKGTEKHDAGQLKLFYHYMTDKNVDVRIVEQTKFEYIKGAKVLCIPEEYNRGATYYQRFFREVYDICILHGTLVGSIYGKDREDLGSNREPVFSMDNFRNCRGPIIAGHVHPGGCFNTYFYYCGSPYRWKFGEEEDKGFLICLHNLDSGSHYTHFQKIESKKYIKLNIEFLINKSPEEIIKYITNFKDKNNIDFIRLDYVNIPTEEQLSILEILKNYYKNNNTIKVNFENIKNKQVINQIKNNIDKYSEYSYILDENLSEYDILSRYINQDKNSQYITSDELIDIFKDI